MRNSNGSDGDGPLYPIKPLPGTELSGPKWDLITPGICVVEPKEWLPKFGTNGPVGWLICSVVLPSAFAGLAVAWFCNIGYDKASKKFTLGYGSKVARTARRLFPDSVQYCDPPLGQLLEHYLVVEVGTADKSRVGGKLTPKPAERQYSKITKILAAGPRVSAAPPSDLLAEQLAEILRMANEEHGIGDRECGTGIDEQ